MVAEAANVYPDTELAPLPLLGSELVCIIEPSRARSRLEIEREPRTLTPQRPLRTGEQYRFHFDMTRCIGCKCCVVACNEQNGNPAAINWRRVGEVEGGYYPNTSRHYLSMGCNHCLEPSCLIGCPVEAYTKDPVTGVVIHDAETCIGCQYCTWNCSYGAPQYNPERGVVGKCDLCHHRLADGMAPACVAACPEEAIAIEIVNVADWRGNFMSADAPGLPSAGDSISTTHITLPEALPPDLGRVDTQRLTLEPPHWPLVFMLVLTQLSVGAFAVLALLDLLGRATSIRVVLEAAATAVISLQAALLHLGRPVHAARALKGWRRSWLSREALGLSLFAGAAAFYAGMLLLRVAGHGAAGVLTFLCGFAGVFCSARIYMVPARPAWNSRYTITEFFTTALLLGPLFLWAMNPGASDGVWLARIASAGAAVQLLATALKFLWLSRSELFELRASALLLSGRVKNAFLVRLALLTGAGVVLPLVSRSSSLATAAFALALASEITGRWLFFVSVTPKSIAAAFLAAEKAA